MRIIMIIMVKSTVLITLCCLLFFLNKIEKQSCGGFIVFVISQKDKTSDR